MKTAVVMLLSMAAISCAQDKKAESRPANGNRDKKRLESVTWDLKNHKLVWVVERGSEKNGEFVANGSDRYEITPDEAVMQVADEKRGFTKEEASSLHKLLDTLSLYCAESVIWWDQGEGVPLDGKTPRRVPAKPRLESEPGPNRQRVDQDEPEPLPAPRRVLVAQTQDDR